MKSITCRQLLAAICSTALLQGTASFSRGSAFVTSTHGIYNRRTHGDSSSSLQMMNYQPSSPGSSNLFARGMQSPTHHTDDPLVNNRYSASDWLHNVFTLPRSSVLRDIRNPVMTIALWSTFVSIAHRFLLKSTNKFLQKFASDICLGSAPHSFLVSSLGLLLVFRTNSAYQRFNEGRVIWENILSISRNISRMIHLYGKEIGTERKQRMIQLIAAFPYLLRHHVRPGCLCEDEQDIPQEQQLLLQDTCRAVIDSRYEGSSSAVEKKDDTSSKTRCYVNKQNFPWSLLQGAKVLKKVTRAQNRPLWVADRVGREVMSIPYGPNFTSRERLSLLSSVDKLTNTVGQCERIHQTAVPLNYARHSLRALTLWLVTLPFCLVKEMGLLTGPAMAVISWLLFGVYQIGYSIEDPFQGSLRLSILCDAIRKDVLGETLERESAYELDDMWDDDDDEEEEDELEEFDVSNNNNKEDALLKELDLVEASVSPYIAPVNQSDLILNAPTLVKESGSWNVVGVREG